ncbi:hypothetical protein C8R46DRAFT_928082, partial [Mycena filopes]
MGKDGAAIPTGTKFLGAVVQRSGAVMLHMDSTDTADWLKNNMDTFLAAMGGTSVFKDRFYNVVVQYVPLSFDPSRDGALRSLEGDNNLPHGALARMRYYKQAERRSPGQRVAHAAVGFKDAASANRFLREGMWVDGRTVYGYKQLAEPIRCLKCQGFNHVVANCPSIHDVCARCGEMHRTVMCKVADDARACANCRNAKREHQGHGAADRACPVFTDKLQFSLERNPDARYPFFPVADDPSSW